MAKEKIVMVDLVRQYEKLEDEINSTVIRCLKESAFINGPEVKEFEKSLANYLDVDHVIACANGTDALQIALMALDLKPGAEILVPAFTYVATAEVIALLGLTPVLVDVNIDDFNIDTESLTRYITKKTKAIVPVHLFGQSANMEKLMLIAKENNLFIIEDNAQAIGSDYTFSNCTKKKSGTIGHIGCTSFFPSKNLGCFGDGGALMTNDDALAAKIRMIANHGQKKKYYHSIIGVNSRLDTLQAAILSIKLRHLDEYIRARNDAAELYDSLLKDISDVEIPKRLLYSTHVFHQYTLKIKKGKRDLLQKVLQEQDIPSMIYYPVPLYKQQAFSKYFGGAALPNTETLCTEVLSLPMHTELKKEAITHISEIIKSNI
ncbi:DegT/DnrJ/EryC1/StrS family aminotransferase [Segetibacter aerophilus]|nr:DegT/DnrJ/EryC1/StrS family aminotransferase [Segetibacter aerophilus]